MTPVKRLTLGLACALLLGAAVPASAGASGVALSSSRAHVSTRLGDGFRFNTAITNVGRTRLTGLVAHLNIVSFTKGVYVDPEDWSSQRTRYLAPLGPGESVTTAWRLKSVNGGDFGAYVVVLPGRSRGAPGQAPVVSPAVGVHVAEHRTLNSGGVLPLVLVVPGLLGLATVLQRLRRRRSLRSAGSPQGPHEGAPEP